MSDKELDLLCVKYVDRFLNLLEVQKAEQYETIDAKFTEYDLKGLVYALDTLHQLLEEQEHE